VIAALLLLALELPLGPFARPGVPVLVTSETRTDVDLAGWIWSVDGPTEVAPPQLPCTIAYPGGTAQVQAVPEGQLLVGALHAAREGAVPIRLVEGMGWQPLDVFDRIVVGRCGAWERAILDAWARAGGDVVDAEAPAEAPRPLPFPRAGSARPEVYDLATARGAGSAAFAVGRRFAFATAAALAILLAAGLLGFLPARAVAALVLVVAAVGGGVGAALTAGAAEPFSRATVVIHYPSRTRVFTMVRAEWNGASMPAPAGVPFFYRGAGDPWWRDGARTLVADRGVIRGFVRDEAPREAAREGDSESRRSLRPLFRSQVPAGAEPRWWWGLEAFQGGNRPVVPILEVEVGGVR